MTRPIDLSRLAVVFLSYDEPEAEENFGNLLRLVARARRVHGIAGFDRAHRFAGAIADTDHVITVDGDNRVSEPNFFQRQYQFAAAENASVISFAARVAHNGLVYGNGGIKIWPRVVLRTLRTHELSRDIGHSVDFAGQVPYFQVSETPSETFVTATPMQAFRAGYREGSRLSLSERRLPFDAFPDLSLADALAAHLGPANRERLRIWCSVGRDRENGAWAMLGARLGCLHTNIDRMPMNRIVNHQWLETFWLENLNSGDMSPDDVDGMIAATQPALSELELGIEDLDAASSARARADFRPNRRIGVLAPS